MEEIIQVALWIFGVFLMIISGLLGWIGIIQRETKKVIMEKNVEQDKRLDGHDDEIHELALQNRETLTIIKHKFKIK